MKGLVLILIALFSIALLGKDIELVSSDGNFSPKYFGLLETGNILENDVIVLPNGRRLIFQKVLGRGNTTVVFQVTDLSSDKVFALRLGAATR